MTIQTRNEVLLEGTTLAAPVLSHENHGARFFRVFLEVPRLSGTPDTLPLILPESMLAAVTPEDSESGSAVYRMDASIDQDNDRLRIGMTAQMNIVLEASEDVLAVPYDAIQTDEEGNSFVYVQTEAGDSESESGRKKVEVTVGMEGDYYVEVSSDELEEGMRVSLSGSGAASGSTDSSGQSEDGAAMPGGGMGGNMGGGAPGGMGGGPGGGM